MNPAFVVPVAELEHGPRRIREPLTVEWLSWALTDTDATPAGPGELQLELSRQEDTILVRGKLGATVHMPCAHTLEPTPVELFTEMFLLLQPKPKAPRAAPKTPKVRATVAGAPLKPETKRKRPEPRWEETPLLSSEDAAIDHFEGDEVVLDGFVREFILLELPITPARSDLRSDQYTANPPVPADSDSVQESTLDPRLAPLAAIAARLRQDKE